MSIKLKHIYIFCITYKKNNQSVNGSWLLKYIINKEKKRMFYFNIYGSLKKYQECEHI